MKTYKTLPNNLYKARLPKRYSFIKNLFPGILDNEELMNDSFAFTQITKSDKFSNLPFFDSDDFNNLFLGFWDKNTSGRLFGFPSLSSNKRDAFNSLNALKAPISSDTKSSKININQQSFVVEESIASSNNHQNIDNNNDLIISRNIVEVYKNSQTQLDQTKLKDNLTVVFAESLQNNSELDLLDIYGIVDKALRDSYDYLSKFRFDPDYSQKLETAFGNDFNRKVADKLFNNFADRNFTDIPTIKIVNSGAIAGGNGAFSDNTQKVYLAVEFINKYASNTARITDVLIEEIGHFVDSQINEIDAPGDEGDIFSELVLGNTISDEALKALKAENDKVTIIRGNNEEIGIEENNNLDVLRVGTWNLFRGDGNTGNSIGTVANLHTDRIKIIANVAQENDIDVMVLQEFNSTKFINLQNAVDIQNSVSQIVNANINVNGTVTYGNFWNVQVVLQEYPFAVENRFANLGPQSGYLILYQQNITLENLLPAAQQNQQNAFGINYSNITSGPQFYNADNDQQRNDWNGFTYTNAQKYNRPPITFTARKITPNGNKNYTFFTWHNDSPGNAPELAFNQFNDLLNNAPIPNSVILGDFNLGNIAPATVWGIQPNGQRNRFQGYNGWTNNHDLAMTNVVNASFHPIALQAQQIQLLSNFNTIVNINNYSNLKSDSSHYPIFAEIQFPLQNNNPPPLYEFQGVNSKGNNVTMSIRYIDGSDPNNTIQLSSDNPENLQNLNLEQSTENKDWFISYDYDGISQPLLFVDDANINFTKDADEKITAFNVAPLSTTDTPEVYSPMGDDQGSVLFKGQTDFNAETLTAKITETGDSGDSGFKLIGGIEVNFDGLSFGEDAVGSPQLRLQGSMLLPKNLVGGNGLLVAINGTDYIGISDNGLEVTGGFVKLPGETSFVVLGLLEIKALDAQVKFDFTNEEITLQGKFTIPTLKNATFDLQGGNYIKVKKTATGLDFSMVANVSASNIPIFGSWEIQDIKLNVNTPNNSFIVNAKLKTPGSPISLALAFNQGKITQITGTSPVGTDFTFLGAAVDIQTVDVIVDKNTEDSEPWDPQFSLQGAIEIPKLKGLKGTLTGTNKLVVNKDNAYLTGVHLSAADIQLGSWKLRNIEADFDGTTNTFSGKAILQTYTGEDINVLLLFDSNGLQNITASNVNFNLFGAKVSNANIKFTPDRRPNEGDTWDPEFKLHGVIALPQALGGITVSVEGNDYLLVNNQGFDLTGGKIYKESLDFNLLGLLRVQGKQISLLYTQVGSEKVFIIQGTVTLPDLGGLTGNFSGSSNYIKINSIGTVEVVGSISASNIDIAGAPGWKIKTATVFIDTRTNNQVKIQANATVEMPSGIDLDAAVLWNGSNLESIKVGVDNLNKPIGVTGAVLNKISGSYDASKGVFKAEATITAGPKVSLNLPSFLGGSINQSLATLNLNAEITSDYISAQGDVHILGDLITGTGEVKLNWANNNNPYFWAKANLNILYGLINANTTLIGRSYQLETNGKIYLDFYAFAQGSINIPGLIPVIGGWTLGSGGVYFQYIDDGDISNDYVAAWGQAFFGTVGLRIGFDGKVDVIGAGVGQQAEQTINNILANLDKPYQRAGIKPIVYVPPVPRITGTDSNDLMPGTDNAEIIDALRGNDTLIGGKGNDTLNGGDGDDTVDYQSSTSGVNVNLANNTANDGFGNTDTLSGIEAVIGSKFNDIINGGTGDNTISGIDGNDTLNGGAGNDNLNGGAGNDNLNGGAGNDNLNGGSGSDTLNGDDGNDNLNGGNINLSSNFSSTSNNYKNSLYGGTGDDTLHGGKIIYNLSKKFPFYSLSTSLKETLNGGDGIDTAAYNINNKGVKVNLKIGNASELSPFVLIQVNTGSNFSLDSPDSSPIFPLRNNIEYFEIYGSQTLISIENIIGSNYEDVLIGDDNNNTIEGGAGNDTLDGGTGNDILDGGTGNDILDGGAGNDTLNLGYSPYSTDTVDGGEGDDLLKVDYSSKSNGVGIHLGYNGANVIYHRAGTVGDNFELVQFSSIERFDITGTKYADAFEGGTGNDIFSGSDGNDILNGGAGNDTLDGGAGIDTLIGGIDNDTYIIDSTTDVITENANEGTDTIQSSVTFSLANLPNVENLTLTGTAAINGIGNAANNIITGNSGNNSLNGGAGNDTLNLGYSPYSTDTVDGGEGDDLLKVDYSSKNNSAGIHLGYNSANVIYHRAGTVYDNFELVQFSSIERFDITGTKYDDAFEGRTGNDIFSGGDGNDILNGGAGNDILNGDDTAATAGFSAAFTAFNNYSPAQGWNSFDQYPRQLADVNGDGRADIVGFGASGVSVALGQTNGQFVSSNLVFNDYTSGWSNFNIMPRQVADVNGDGRADIVGFGSNAVYVALGKANGTFDAAFTAFNNYSPAQGWNSFDQYPRQLADVNGDGRADIVGFGASGVSVALGQTNGQFVSSNILFNDYTTGWSNFNIMPRQVADVNGDGRADIVGFGSNAVYVALGKANGTFDAAFTAFNDYSPAQGWNSFDQYPRQLADVNGDSRADIVAFGASGVSVALGQTDGKFVSSNILFNDYTTGWSNFNIMPRQVADVNGDGRADIVGFGSNAVYVALAKNSNDILNGGAGNDILKGGTGKDTLTGGTESDRFDYRNLADSLLKSFDVITDFNATAGNDLFLVSTARSGFSNAGSVANLSVTGIAAKLTTANFGSNSAAQFTFGSRTFVAINDDTAGFNANSDAIIEVTGLTGTLTASNFIGDSDVVFGINSVPGGGISISSGGFTHGDTTYVPITDNPSIQLNEITGTPGRDTLIGISTSDRITGLQGADTITGGDGNDEFVYTNIRDNGDTITDFEVGKDNIVFTQLLDSLVTGGYNGANAIADGYVKVVQGSSTSNFSVQIDADGSTGDDIFRPFITVNLAGTGTLNNPSSFVF